MECGNETPETPEKQMLLVVHIIVKFFHFCCSVLVSIVTKYKCSHIAQIHRRMHKVYSQQCTHVACNVLYARYKEVQSVCVRERDDEREGQRERQRGRESEREREMTENVEISVSDKKWRRTTHTHTIDKN